MSGTLSSSSEVSICSQTESAETRHSENEREVCIMQKCNRHLPYLSPVSQLSTAVQRTPEIVFLSKARMRKNVDIQLKDGLEILD